MSTLDAPVEAVDPEPAPPATTGGSTARRGVWNLVDQAVSSASSALLALLLAHGVDRRAFGSFSLAYSAVAFVIGLASTVTTVPLQVRFSGSAGPLLRRAHRSATGTSLLTGAIGGLVLLLLGVAVRGDTGRALLATAIGLPALLGAETARQTLRAAGRPSAAVVVDLCYAVVQALAVLVALGQGRHSVPLAVLAWSASAGLAAVVGWRLLDATPDPRPTRVAAWLREHRDLSGWLLADYAIVLGSQQVTTALIAVIVDVEGVGALRGAQVLLGPLNILGFSATAFVVPELSRRPGLPAAALMRAAAATSGALVAATMSWAGILLALPDGVGADLLGASWLPARAVLLPVAATLAGTLAATGPLCVLLARGQTRPGLRIGLLYAALGLAGGVGGAATGGVRAAAWGAAIATFLVIPLWWAAAARAARTPRPVDAR